MLSVWCCLVFFYWPAIVLLTVCLLPGEFLQAALSMMDPMGKTDMAWKKHLKPFLKTRVMPPLEATELCENDLFCGGFTFEVLLHLISFDLFISFIFWYLLIFLFLLSFDVCPNFSCWLSQGSALQVPHQVPLHLKKKNTTFPQLSSSDSNLNVWSYFRSISFITYQKWKQKARGLEIIGYGLLTRPTGQTQVLNRVRSWKPGNL